MRLTKAQREENHGRILHTAAKLFRERGVDGVGIDEIMETAGLTHGAFYGHFPSKAALAAKAGEQALKEGRPLLFEEGGRPRETLSEMADFYLSAAHRDNPGIGCAVASLAADMGRQPLEARAGFADGLNITLDRLAAALLGDPDGKREEAIVSFAVMVGALTMARGTAGTPLSEEILKAARDRIKASGVWEKPD